MTHKCNSNQGVGWRKKWKHYFNLWKNFLPGRTDYRRNSYVGGQWTLHLWRPNNQYQDIEKRHLQIDQYVFLLACWFQNPKIWIWPKANLNNIYALCVTPKQPKPPFLQGKGTDNFWPFQVASTGFPPFVELFIGCQLEMIDLHRWVGIRCSWLPAKKERAVFQERCHKQRWGWGEAVDFTLRLNTQGAQPTSRGSIRTQEVSDQAVHLAERRGRINICRGPTTS